MERYLLDPDPRALARRGGHIWLIRAKNYRSDRTEKRLLMVSHREIPVKVTAWVDEGVAPLVLALSEIEDVMTVDSCQDDADHGAYVFFVYRGDGRSAALFAAELASALAPHERAADYTLGAEWRPGTDEPVFRLACPADHIDGLVRVLNEAFLPTRGTDGRGFHN